MNILWLCSWYPSRLFPFNGDFIKRHAEATSLFENITVIHVVRDVSGVLTKDYLIEDFNSENLREIIGYYYSPANSLRVYDQIVSLRKYRKISGKIINEYFKTNGLPDLVHVHVGMNAGLIAQAIKRKNNIPYVISEHWTGFLSEATDNFNGLSFIQRYLWERVLKNATSISMVSEYLRIAMQKKFPYLEGEIIKNVVNTEIFYPAVSDIEGLNFIHISTLNEFKRPEKIIQAFQKVLSVFPTATLEIFGPKNLRLVTLVDTLNLNQSVFLYREVPQKTLAHHIRKSVALVLYSSYETFGCVIIEANACGVPVVVSDIPVFHENVAEGRNGHFADKESVESLAASMLLVVRERSNLPNKELAEFTEANYGYTTIGAKISQWYRNVIAEN